MIVLGSAAGGAFPQWNSNAPACRRARAGDPAAKRRGQASLAVSSDGARWFLLNASPDLRQQVEETPALQPREGLRSSPIAGVVLTGGDVDAVAGLLHLRERQPLVVYATARVQAVLAANPIFEVLAPNCVRRESVPLGRKAPLLDARDRPIGLAVELFPVPGKVPLYLEKSDPSGVAVHESEDTVGVEVSEPASGARFFFVPGCAAVTADLAARLAGAPLVFFDGTLWTDDEMIRLGLGEKTGRRMGHISVTGEGGAIAAFRSLEVERKIFIHINNSNPMLLADSLERRIVAEAGWEVAEDGMEIAL
jgi:pyrroloquinoline quinone biosynthesis protein B